MRSFSWWIFPGVDFMYEIPTRYLTRWDHNFWSTTPFLRFTYQAITGEK